MKSHIQIYLAIFPKAGMVPRALRLVPMRRVPMTIALSLLTVLSVVFLRGEAALAVEQPPPLSGMTSDTEHRFDWVAHTQRTLDELKIKLNLASVQLPAWNVWSQGVLADGKLQLAQKKNGADPQRSATTAPVAETTPEKMARGIERLKAETAWMQEHLVQLEAARVRTSAFYDTLDTNQRTIFDLFWHELYHRVSGHDQSGNLPLRRIVPPVT